jgi:hypothetical protein
LSFPDAIDLTQFEMKEETAVKYEKEIKVEEDKIQDDKLDLKNSERSLIDRMSFLKENPQAKGSKKKKENKFILHTVIVNRRERLIRGGGGGNDSGDGDDKKEALYDHHFVFVRNWEYAFTKKIEQTSGKKDATDDTKGKNWLGGDDEWLLMDGSNEARPVSWERVCAEAYGTDKGLSPSFAPEIQTYIQELKTRGTMEVEIMGSGALMLVYVRWDVAKMLLSEYDKKGSTCESVLLDEALKRMEEEEKRKKEEEEERNRQ